MLENKYKQTLEKFCRSHLYANVEPDMAKVVPMIYKSLPGTVRPTATMTQDIVFFVQNYLKENRQKLARKPMPTKTTKSAKVAPGKKGSTKVTYVAKAGPQRGPDGKFLPRDHPLYKVDGKTNMEWNLIERARGTQRLENGQQKPKTHPTFIHRSGWTTEQLDRYGDDFTG